MSLQRYASAPVEQCAADGPTLEFESRGIRTSAPRDRRRPLPTRIRPVGGPYSDGAHLAERRLARDIDLAIMAWGGQRPDKLNRRRPARANSARTQIENISRLEGYRRFSAVATDEKEVIVPADCRNEAENA